MIDQLQEIASYLAEGGAYELKRWWRIVDRWIKGLLTAILLWPIAMIVCAITSTWMAEKVVPFLALMPAAFLLYFIVQRVANPATIALLAVPKIRAALLKTFRTLAAAIAAELLLGLYLWLFPISNDRWLFPGLALALLAFFALRLAEIGGAIRNLLVLLIIGITVIFILGGRDSVKEQFRTFKAAGTSEPGVAFHPDAFSGSDGRRVAFDRSAFGYSTFTETFPVGYWVLMKIPSRWHGHWNAFPTDGKSCTLAYFMIPPSHNPAGPYNWCSSTNLPIPSVFWVQAIQSGETIKFSTDDPDIPNPTEDQPSPQAPAHPVFSPTTFAQRFCDDNKQQDFSGDTFTLILQEGCFAGEFIVPKDWRTYAVDKSQHEGDWAAVWSDGRDHPSKIHAYYEDFDDGDFRNTNKFYLQGKGTVHLTKLK